MDLRLIRRLQHVGAPGVIGSSTRIVTGSYLRHALVHGSLFSKEQHHASPRNNLRCSSSAAQSSAPIIRSSNDSTPSSWEAVRLLQSESANLSIHQLRAAIERAVQAELLEDIVVVLEDISNDNQVDRTLIDGDVLFTVLQPVSAARDLHLIDRLLTIMMAAPEQRMDTRSTSTCLTMLASIPDHERGIGLCSLVSDRVPTCWGMYMTSIPRTAISSFLHAVGPLLGGSAEKWCQLLRAAGSIPSFHVYIDRIFKQGETDVQARGPAPAGAKQLVDAYMLSLVFAGRRMEAAGVLTEQLQAVPVVVGGERSSEPVPEAVQALVPSAVLVLGCILEPFSKGNSDRIPPSVSEAAYRLVDCLQRVGLLQTLLVDAEMTDHIVQALKLAKQWHTLVQFIVSTVKYEVDTVDERIAAWQSGRTDWERWTGRQSKLVVSRAPKEDIQAAYDARPDRVYYKAYINRTTIHRAMNDLATQGKAGTALLEAIVRCMEAVPASYDRQVPRTWTLQPNNITLSLMLRHYAILKQEKSCMDILSLMRSKGYSPTISARLALARYVREMELSSKLPALAAAAAGQAEDATSAERSARLAVLDKLVEDSILPSLSKLSHRMHISEVVEERSMQKGSRPTRNARLNARFLHQEALRVMPLINQTAQEYFALGMSSRALRLFLRCYRTYAPMVARPDTFNITARGLLYAGGTSIAGWLPQSLDKAWGGSAGPRAASPPAELQYGFGQSMSFYVPLKERVYPSIDLKRLWKGLTVLLAAEYRAAGGVLGVQPTVEDVQSVLYSSTFEGGSEYLPCPDSVGHLLSALRSFRPRVTEQASEDGKGDLEALVDELEATGDAKQDLLPLLQHFTAIMTGSSNAGREGAENEGAGRSQRQTVGTQDALAQHTADRLVHNLLNSAIHTVPLQRCLQLFLTLYSSAAIRGGLLESVYLPVLLPNTRTFDCQKAEGMEVLSMFVLVLLYDVARRYIILGETEVSGEGIYVVTGNSGNLLGSRLANLFTAELGTELQPVVKAFRGLVIPPTTVNKWLLDLKGRVQSVDEVARCSALFQRPRGPEAADRPGQSGQNESWSQEDKPTVRKSAAELLREMKRGASSEDLALSAAR